MLIIQFAFAILTGLVFAIAAFIGGYGIAWALLIYSFAGAIALVTSMVATMFWAERRTA